MPSRQKSAHAQSTTLKERVRTLAGQPTVVPVSSLFFFLFIPFHFLSLSFIFASPFHSPTIVFSPSVFFVLFLFSSQCFIFIFFFISFSTVALPNLFVFFLFLFLLFILFFLYCSFSFIILFPLCMVKSWYREGWGLHI